MTTDKRAAAIAALGGPEKARDRIAIFRAMMGDHVDASAFCDLVLHAIEADDGRALLHKAKAQMQESHDWVSDRNQKWGLARAMQVIDEILAAPEQPAPNNTTPMGGHGDPHRQDPTVPNPGPGSKPGCVQSQPARATFAQGPATAGSEAATAAAGSTPASGTSLQPAPEPAAPHADDEDNAGTSGKGQTDGQVQEVRRQADHLPPVFPGEQVSRRVPEIPVQRGSVATNAASGDERVEERATPAQPYRGEPERVAHADDEARILAWATGPVAERTPAKAVAIMRSLAAGKAKAEADLHAAHVAFGTIDNALGGHGWTSIDDVVARAQGVKPRNEQHRRMDAKHVADLNNDIADLRANLADAQAEVERLTGVIDDTTNTEATNADTVADLRAKLADAERERDDLREQVGDKGFSLLQQERDEAVADMLSVAQQVGIVYEAEGHAPKAGPTPAILRAIAAMQRDADDAPRLRSAGVSLKFKLTEATAERDAAVAKLAEAEKRLTTAMCNVAEAEDERNDARSSCFAAKAERDAAVAKLADAERQTQRWKVAALEMQKQRDAALAAQNAVRSGIAGYAYRYHSHGGCVHTEFDNGGARYNGSDPFEAVPYYLGTSSRDVSVARLEQSLEADGYRGEQILAAIRAAKPEPADYADSKFGPWPGDAKPEPVPAAADAKPGDEVLRMVAGDSADNNGATGDYARAVRELCRRALEVRP